MMNIVKLSTNGQITLPAEIRDLLSLRFGDKIMLHQNHFGEIVLSNASAKALEKVQNAMSGVAEELDVHNEEDVQKLVDQVRYA